MTDIDQQGHEQSSHTDLLFEKILELKKLENEASAVKETLEAAMRGGEEDFPAFERYCDIAADGDDRAACHPLSEKYEALLDLIGDLHYEIHQSSATTIQGAIAKLGLMLNFMGAPGTNDSPGVEMEGFVGVYNDLCRLTGFGGDMLLPREG